MDAPQADKPTTMYSGPPPGQGKIKTRRSSDDGPSCNPIPMIGIPLLVILGGYAYLRSNPDMPLPAPVAAAKGRIDEAVNAIQERIKPGSSKAYKSSAAARAKSATTGNRSDPKQDQKKGPKKGKKPAKIEPPAPLLNPVTLYLTNGGVVTGDLIDETPTQVILRFDYGDVGFHRPEIQRLVRGGATDAAMVLPWEGQASSNAWTYQQDVVIRLMKGTVIDRPITSVTAEAVVSAQVLPSGGTVEQTIKRTEIESLLFRPMTNTRSATIDKRLQELFPKMQRYDEGLFTLFTDSPPPAAKASLRTIRQLATDWYLTFWPVIRGRAPEVQQYLVIFDDWASYIEYAATDGVPGWLAVGYFHPEHEVLYSFNMVGERFSGLLYDAYLGQFRRYRDQVSRAVQGSGYEESIEGQISDFLRKLERAHSMVRQVFTGISGSILRHEMVHSLFHAWGAQNVLLSAGAPISNEDVQRKRAFLTATEPEQKRRALEGLLKPADDAPQDLRASNSWFVEGLAGYMEPEPIGAVNHLRLPDAQAAQQANQLLPIEFLHVFQLGSFSGMATQSALNAYAQSWALCHWLMQEHTEAFLTYVTRLATERPATTQDTLPWLLEALKMDSKTMDTQFSASLQRFPPEDPLWLKQINEAVDLRAELIAEASRMGL